MEEVRKVIPFELQHISFSQIEIFFRCAETMNFTKAAESLLITPGMVSKKIAALESELGFALFVREKNHVSLTPEGEALFAAWRQPATSMVSAVTGIRNRRLQSGVVSLVIWSSTNLERFLVPLLSACTADMDLSFRISLSEKLTFPDILTTGKSDVVIAPKFLEPGLSQMDELQSFLALPTPLCAAMSPENPLSGKKTLQMEDLKNAEFLVPEQKGQPRIWYYDMLRTLCLAHGFSPKCRPLDEDAFLTYYLNMDKKSVLVTDKYFHAFSSNAAEYRELSGTESGLLLVYLKNARPLVQTFVEYARTFYKELR